MSIGVVKTHFYHIWVQLKIFRKTKEIRRLHEILADVSRFRSYISLSTLTLRDNQLQLPSKLGRLPKLIGEPAGRSLTADQWLILATIVGPLVVCVCVLRTRSKRDPNAMCFVASRSLGRCECVRRPPVWASVLGSAARHAPRHGSSSQTTTASQTCGIWRGEEGRSREAEFCRSRGKQSCSHKPPYALPSARSNTRLTGAGASATFRTCAQTYREGQSA